jgi:hypothetical protein
MTTDTIQGNKLIAQFMGILPDVYNPERYVSSTWPDTIFATPSEMRYHSSWNWLMPVVEKISLMNYPDEPTFPEEEDYVPDTAYPRTFGMISRNGQFMVRFNRQPLFEADTLIEAAWMAVVDFVKTYNELKMSHESPHSNSPHSEQ